METKAPAASASPPTGIAFEKSPQSFAWVPTWKIGLGDMDRDGDLDAVFANSQANHSQVWLNDGNGTFVDSGQILLKYGHGIDIGDLDGDGDLDLFLTTHQASRPSKVYLNDGHALFEDSGQDYFNVGYHLILADVDLDGDLDALAVDTSATKIYTNDGTGRYTLSEIALPPASIAGDLDSDGAVDLLFKEERIGYSVMLNDGEGFFSRHWAYEDSAAMLLGDSCLGDVDGDGDLDAVITNGHFQSTSHPALVFLNDGTGQFTDSGQRLSAVSNAGVTLGDLDNDGDLDLVLNDHEEPSQIWLNDGAGRFTDSEFRFGGYQFYRHAHLGDLDGDGDLDIFLATFGIGGGPNEVWFNNAVAAESTAAEASDLYLGQKPPGTAMEVFAPGVVSIEEGKEYKITISPDLQEVFFTRRTPGGRDDRLWFSRLEGGTLTTARLATFSYDALESDACFTPDGKRLYFNSWRPLPGADAPSAHHNVWYVDRVADGWSEPQLVGSPLNDYRPVYFSIADDGTLYFTRSSPREIWYADPEGDHYGEAQRLPDEINDLRDVAHPAIAPDESYIIVDSVYLQGNRLAGYLYISFHKPDGSWTKAVSLRDALNAPVSAVHASPRITPDGKFLLFEEYHRETDKADIYWVSTEALEELRTRALEDVPDPQVLAGHTGAVSSLDFSPDGEILASTGQDETVRLWDIATGQVIRVLPGGSHSVKGVDFGPDGSLLATIEPDQTIAIWDLDSGEVIRRIGEPGLKACGLEFSPGGGLLASGHVDKLVRLWDVESGQLVRTLGGMEGLTCPVAFSPDGALVASGGGNTDARVLIWEAATGELLHTLTGHDPNVYRVVFAPDGTLLASASGDRTAKIWDLASGKLLHSLDADQRKLMYVAFSPDGRLLATGGDDGQVRLWDVASGELARTLRGHAGEIYTIAFAPVDSLLASAGEGGDVLLWFISLPQ